MTNPPFFLVGPSRSGTTLLGRIVGSHSRLAVYFETQYYPILGSDRHRYGDLGRRANLERLLRDVVEIATAQGLMRPPTSDELFARLPAATFEGVLAAWLQLFAERAGKARGGDKTPEHYRVLPELLERFPESPVIFTVRDPRDVAISAREAFGTPLAASAWAWRDAVDILRLAARPVHVVRYEELVERPVEVGEALCAFLGERWEPEMLRFFETHRPSRAGRYHRRLGEPVSAASVGRFEALPPADIACIEAICDGMETWGYPSSRSQGTPRGLAPPRRRDQLANRIRFYLRDPRRIRRGWLRWRIVLRLRVRWLLGSV